MNDIPHIVAAKKDEPFVMQIPECCREGHEDCPHVVNRKPEQKRKNPAL